LTLTTHRISFEEVPEQFDQFTDPNLGAIKAIIEVRMNARNLNARKLNARNLLSARGS
jgi:hypothetical protein